MKNPALKCKAYFTRSDAMLVFGIWGIVTCARTMVNK